MPVVEWWRNLSRGDRVRLILAAAVVIALGAGYAIQKHREPHVPGRDDRLISTTGAAARLTAIQLGHHPGPANAMLRRIDSLLELLEGDCPADTRGDLERLTIRTIHALARDGISVEPNGVLGGVVGSTNMGATADCAVFFHRYAERQRAGA